MKKEYLLEGEGPVDPFDFIPQLCPTDAERKRVNGSRFGCSRDGGASWHGGIDLEAKEGTPFKSIYSGKVTMVRDLKPTDPDYKKGVGNFIIVRSKSFSIKYCHLSQIGVKVGAVVKSGEALGETGKSGNAYSVPYKHLHLELSIDHFATNKHYADPESYLATKYKSDGTVAGVGETPHNPNDPVSENCPGFLTDELFDTLFFVAEDLVAEKQRVSAIAKSLLEVGADNWLEVRREANNSVIPLSKYVRADNNSFIGSGTEARERFRVLDWPYKMEYITVKALPDRRSRLGNTEYNIGAVVEFDKNTSTLTVNRGLFTAKAGIDPGTPLPNGEYLLSLADAPHKAGIGYLGLTPYALTWFFINDSDTVNRYLHTGSVSEGCLTVGVNGVEADIRKWTEIARFLLTQRLAANDNYIGKLLVKG